MNRIILKKHIHSCFAASSTGDITVEKVIDDCDFTPFVGLQISGQNFSGGTIEEISFDINKREFHCWVEPDKEYYDYGLKNSPLSFKATPKQMSKKKIEYLKNGWGIPLI